MAGEHLKMTKGSNAYRLGLANITMLMAYVDTSKYGFKRRPILQCQLTLLAYFLYVDLIFATDVENKETNRAPQILLHIHFICT